VPRERRGLIVVVVIIIIIIIISQCSGDQGESAFLFQRVFVLLQRYNSILLHDSFIREDCRSNGHCYNFLY